MQGEARQARKGEEHSRQSKSSHNGNTVLTLEERGQWSKGMRPGWGKDIHSKCGGEPEDSPHQRGDRALLGSCCKRSSDGGGGGR